MSTVMIGHVPLVEVPLLGKSKFKGVVSQIEVQPSQVVHSVFGEFPDQIVTDNKVKLVLDGYIVKEDDMALNMNKPGAKPGQQDYTSHLVSKPTEGTVTVEKKSAGQEWPGPAGESKIIHPGVFCKKNTGLCITIEGGQTLNLGNYESARVSVSLTLPCDPETLNEAYEWGSSWVSDRIEEGVKLAKGQG